MGAPLRLSKRPSVVLTALSLGVVAALLYYVWISADAYAALLRLSAGGVLGIVLVTVTFPLISGLINCIVFRGLGARMTYRDGSLLAASATMANLLPIPGGIVARGVYMKREHGLSYTKYLSATIALYLWSLVLSGSIGLVILAVWWLGGQRSFSPLLWLGFGAMAGSALIFRVPLNRMHIPYAIRGRLSQALEGWTFIRRDSGMLPKLLGLQALMTVLLSIRYCLAFQMLSQELTFGQALLFSTASILTQLVSIAPGGLGVREAIVGSVARALGFGLAVGVGASGLDRLISTPVIVLIGWTSTVLLGRQIGRGSPATSERDK